MAEKGVSGAAALLGITGIYLIYVGIKDIPTVEGLRLLTRGQKPAEASRSSNTFAPFDWTDKTQVKQAIADSWLNIPLAGGGSRNAADMVQIPGTSIRVYKGIAKNVTSMVVSARASGVTLDGGGYRSSAEQADLRRRNGCPDLISPSSTCDTPTAPVGHSQHELGLAIDFNNCQTKSTPVYRWLAGNAYRFGFKNLPGEPWHWSTTGK